MVIFLGFSYLYFCSVALPLKDQTLQPFAIIFPAILLVVILTLYCCASFSDPGIIQRICTQSSEQVDYAENDKSAYVKGREFRLTVCAECKIISPARSYHCPDCGCCIEGYDY